MVCSSLSALVYSSFIILPGKSSNLLLLLAFAIMLCAARVECGMLLADLYGSGRSVCSQFGNCSSLSCNSASVTLCFSWFCFSNLCAAENLRSGRQCTGCKWEAMVIFAKVSLLLGCKSTPVCDLIQAAVVLLVGYQVGCVCVRICWYWDASMLRCFVCLNLLVQTPIEQCLQLHMSQKEGTNTISHRAKIEPSLTELGAAVPTTALESWLVDWKLLIKSG
ncbi:hypothetical protein LOK49_LG12G01208 [Camellia lanceoleosa]|uniref:Uncharacterized protein n=1 Tax=Camellia lanceoleosa TaxID=1840588 RepID=A0ACC0FX78_9ERIC|nr:hypothetical protein LOK49_LG12G01208 [Camellia lanceoleosa]